MSLVYSLCFYLNVPPRKAIEIRTIKMGSIWMWNRKDIFIFFGQSKKYFFGNYLVSLYNSCFIMRFHKEFCPILISFGLSRSSAIILIIEHFEIAWELYMHVCLQLENESFSFLFFITFKQICSKKGQCRTGLLRLCGKMWNSPQLILVFDIAWWQLFE